MATQPQDNAGGRQGIDMAQGPALSDEPPIPQTVRQLAGGRSLELVWRNSLGGLTYRASGSGSGETVYVKWTPATSGLDLVDEATRMRWAADHVSVPRVIDAGENSAGSWLMTGALDGDSAVSERWKADPSRAVTAIGEGIRIFHESLPVEDCPFSWSAEDRLRVALARAGSGPLDRSGWHRDHEGLTDAEARRRVAEVPTVEKLVVCHGDTCAPNTNIGEDGRWIGVVDLGQMGIADRWADIAVALWSTNWNYGPGWERQLLDAYGVEPDHERMSYYRLLWDIG